MNDINYFEISVPKSLAIKSAMSSYNRRAYFFRCIGYYAKVILIPMLMYSMCISKSAANSDQIPLIIIGSVFIIAFSLHSIHEHEQVLEKSANEFRYKIKIDESGYKIQYILDDKWHAENWANIVSFKEAPTFYEMKLMNGSVSYLPKDDNLEPLYKFTLEMVNKRSQVL